MPERDFDDDRDPPRRPRRRDDDFDDRPREKRGGNKTLFIVLGVVGGVMLLVCGGGGALTLFATSSVREAAARAKTQNNLKQIGLAYHNHEDMGNPLTVPFARDPGAAVLKGGGGGGVNRALSFRADLLPYLEQESLYRTIDRAQAWDAPRNAGPCSTPVSSFQTAVDMQAPRHHTPFRAFVGGGALFSADGKPAPLSAMQDGMSNTLLLVEAAETVPWAEPRELAYSKTAPLPPFGGAGKRGPMVLMADGSIRVLSKNVPEAVLRSAIEPGDNVRVDFDAMK